MVQTSHMTGHIQSERFISNQSSYLKMKFVEHSPVKAEISCSVFPEKSSQCSLLDGWLTMFRTSSDTFFELNIVAFGAIYLKCHPAHFVRFTFADWKSWWSFQSKNFRRPLIHRLADRQQHLFPLVGDPISAAPGIFRHYCVGLNAGIVLTRKGLLDNHPQGKL